MIELTNNILNVGVDEVKGGDIVLLRHIPDGRVFTHRMGLQSWLKSGTRVDPASNILSNHYGGVASPEFPVVALEENKVELETTLNDLRVFKKMELNGAALNVSVTVENISNDNKVHLQLENFCNLAGAKFAERENTVTFPAVAGSVAGGPIRLERFAQRFVETFAGDGAGLVVGNSDWRSFLEISMSDDAESLACVIHANRLCWGVNAPKTLLAPGGTFSYSLTFEIRRGSVLDAYPELKKVKPASKPAKTAATADFDSIFTGEPVFKERWSHLCLQYDATKPDDLRRIIADILAPMRYTGVVFELDRGVALESHPEIAADFALPINEVVKVAEFAKEHGLKVGVEFNTPGHQNETGMPEAHPELMEPKPANIPGHVLCVANPATRKLVGEIIIEILDTFDLDMLHLGSDEVQFEGYKGSAFGHCEHSKGETPAAIFADYLSWLTSLPSENVTLAVWSDIFLRTAQFGPEVGGNGSEGELWKAVSALPKETILLDWHYYPAGEYKSLDYFSDSGFEAWPVTAFSFDGIRDFLAYAEKTGVDKTMHTTWSVPNPEKLFVETIVWAAVRHWLGSKADDVPVRELALNFSRSFW
jgi:hypothetical protein